MTYVLGSFRPLVGAVSGGIAYLLLQSGLVGQLSGKSDTFYWAVGVLAGFSERLVPDMLTHSAGTLEPPTTQESATNTGTQPS